MADCPECAERDKEIARLKGIAKPEAVEPVAIRQLRQLLTVTDYDDLISQEMCERLLHCDLIERCMGDHCCLNKRGVELCWALGLLDGEEGVRCE